MLAGQGIRVLPRATAVADAARRLGGQGAGAAAGVMVTASHNPPAYNGYKVYWDNGAQIIPPHDAGIAAAIAKIGPGERDAAACPRAEAAPRGLFDRSRRGPARRYLEADLGARAPPRAGARPRHRVHAAARRRGPLRVEALAPRRVRAGPHRAVAARARRRVPDRALPEPRGEGRDGSRPRPRRARRRPTSCSPTIPTPIASAAGARDRDGRLRAVPGDQLGVLLGGLPARRGGRRARQAAGRDDDRVVQLLGVIARELGAATPRRSPASSGSGTARSTRADRGPPFVFGYEEALGYSVGDVVRDKDGVSAALVFAELAGWNRARGVTPWGYLEEIQRAHGLFLSAQKSVTIPGAEGAATIAAVMDGFRASPPAAIGGLAVVETRDYRAGVRGPADVQRRRLPARGRLARHASAVGDRAEDQVLLRAARGRPGGRGALRRRRHAARGRLAALVADFVRLAVERGQPGVAVPATRRRRPPWRPQPHFPCRMLARPPGGRRPRCSRVADDGAVAPLRRVVAAPRRPARGRRTRACRSSGASRRAAGARGRRGRRTP